MSNDVERMSASPEEPSLSVVPKMPRLPVDVVRRFPSLIKWQDDMARWTASLEKSLRGIRFKQLE